MGDGRLMGKVGLDEDNHLRYPPHIENSHQLMLFGSRDAEVGDTLYDTVADSKLSIFHQIVDHARHLTPRDDYWNRSTERRLSPFFDVDNGQAHTAYDPTTELDEIQALTDQYKEILNDLNLKDLVDYGFQYAVTNGNPANNTDWKAVLDMVETANAIGFSSALSDVKSAVAGSSYNPDEAEQDAGKVNDPTLVSVDPIETPSGPTVSAPSVTTEVDDAIAAYKNRQRRDLAKNLTSIASGLFDIRGVMTTTFDQQMAIAHLAAEDQVSDFDQQLRQERVRLQNQNRVREMELQAQIDNQIASIIANAHQRDRELEVEAKTRHEQLKVNVGQHNDSQKWNSHIQSRESILRGYDRQMSHEERIKELNVQQQQAKLQAANTIVQGMIRQHAAFLAAKGQIYGSVFQAQHESNKQRITIRNDEIDHNIQLDRKDRMWNLDLWKYANQGMGAAQGTPAQEADRTFDRLMEGAGGISAGLGLYSKLWDMLT